MKTTRKILHGQPGAKKLQKQYGSDLLCVRYGYDREQGVKLKTIELIVERGPWQCRRRRIPDDGIIYLRIEYGEVDLGRQVKAAGGKWNAKKRVWELPYKDAVALKLTERIIPGTDG